MKCFPSIALLNFGAEARLFIYLPYARITMPCSCRKWGNYLICLKKYIIRKMIRFVAKNVISIDNNHKRSINCELTIHLLHPWSFMTGGVSTDNRVCCWAPHSHTIKRIEKKNKESLLRNSLVSSVQTVIKIWNIREIPPKFHRNAQIWAA